MKNKQQLKNQNNGKHLLMKVNKGKKQQVQIHIQDLMLIPEDVKSVKRKGVKRGRQKNSKSSNNNFYRQNHKHHHQIQE